MIDGRKGPVGVFDRDAEVTEHAEGLRAGDLVDEVSANEELGAAVGEGAHGVSVPDFFVECFSHGVYEVGGDG